MARLLSESLPPPPASGPLTPPALLPSPLIRNRGMAPSSAAASIAARLRWRTLTHTCTNAHAVKKLKGHSCGAILLCLAAPHSPSLPLCDRLTSRGHLPTLQLWNRVGLVSASPLFCLIARCTPCTSACYTNPRGLVDTSFASGRLCYSVLLLLVCGCCCSLRHVPTDAPLPPCHHHSGRACSCLSHS